MYTSGAVRYIYAVQKVDDNPISRVVVTMNVIAVKPRHAQLRDALQELRKQVPTDQAYLESTCNILEIRVSLHILYI